MPYNLPSVPWITPCVGVAPFVPLNEMVSTGAPLGVTAKIVPKLEVPPTDEVVHRFPSEACRNLPMTYLLEASVSWVTCWNVPERLIEKTVTDVLPVAPKTP